MPELAEQDKSSEASSVPSSLAPPEPSDFSRDEETGSNSGEEIPNSSTRGYDCRGSCMEKQLSSDTTDLQYEENESE